MSLTFHRGRNVPRWGARVVPDETRPFVSSPVHEDDETWYSKGTSKQIETMFEPHMNAGRENWAQLCVEVDNVPLYFWLPEELQHVCATFATRPFPTALSLARKEQDEPRLNRHWLSRLPKSAKAAKFRQRFVNYVQLRPPELLEFERFYAGS